MIHALGGGDILYSILQTIKKLLGIEQEYDVFDNDLIIHINSALSVLTQLNVGPKTGFMITGDSETWDDLNVTSKISMVKTFIHLKVRLIFDPPSSSFVLESIKNLISELEWRLCVECDPITTLEGGDSNE